MLTKTHPEEAKKLIELAQEDVNEKWDYYAGLAKTNGSTEN
jgi:hypothetical protein